MPFINKLNIDVETKSGEDLKKAGLYKYCAHVDFAIIIFCYSLNDSPVHTVDLYKGQEIPQKIIDLILDPTCEKFAWNAMFERTTISRHLGKQLSAESWTCTMVKAGMMGLPMHLKECGIALGTPSQKMSIGKSLIRIFCVPQKPSKKNGFKLWYTPADKIQQWEEFKDYCAEDVYTEMDIAKAIEHFEPIEREKKLYILDQKINDRGILMDAQFIIHAIRHSAEYTQALIEEATQITGLENPKSVKQLKEWLELEIDETIPSLSADAVLDLLKKYKSETIQRVLKIRQSISKTSVKKYNAMLNMMMSDSRVRGVIRFYGANKTGRFASSGVQIHNLYKNDTERFPDLAILRDLERRGNFLSIDMAYDTSEALAQLIRTAIIPPNGSWLCMSDFAAIEARVLAWLAGEEWKLDVFRGHGKIYEATGANMFNIPIEKITKGSHYRASAKIAELACGYQGAVQALKNMAKKQGINLGTDAQLVEIVGRWRDANPKIVKFWYDVEKFAIAAVRTGKRISLRNLTFFVENKTLFIQLPSGRSLAYYMPKIIPNENGYPKLVYHGVNPKTFQYQQIPLYGGLLTENVVQATSRDILCEKMLALDEAGFDIMLHVHDEAVCNIGHNIDFDNPDAGDIADIEDARMEMHSIMIAPLSWTDGLPLNADTTVSPFYKKD